MKPAQRSLGQIVVTIPPSEYYALISTEGAQFLNACEFGTLIHQVGDRYRLRPEPPWRIPDFTMVRENMGRTLSPADVCKGTDELYTHESVYGAIRPFLLSGGEFLPIRTDGGHDWHAFILTPFGPLAPFAEITAKGIIRRNHADMAKPLPKTPRAGVMPWRRVKGRGDFVRWFEFDETTVAGRHVFRAQYQGKPETLMFVSRAFVEAAVAHGLRGLDYHVTAKPEGPLWHTDPRDKDFPFWY